MKPPIHILWIDYIKMNKFKILLLIAVPSLILLGFKEALFKGGDEKRLPTLSVVSKDPIPAFSFINQYQDTITNEDYKGKIYIANFIFTRCPTICKDMSFNMEYLQGKLSRYDNILYLSHTIDPEYDTPMVLKEYAEKYERQLGADLESWNFVTGDKDQIYDIARSYLCAAEESDEESTGGFIHSSSFILIDDQGRIRSGYDSHNNPIGVYDGTSVPSVKDLIVDVGVLVSEIKREKRKKNK